MSPLAPSFYQTVGRATEVSWMLGVDRFGAILGTFKGGVLLSLGWELLTHYGRFGGARGGRCYCCPAEGSADRADLPDRTSCWFSTARPITAAATLPFPATSRSYIFRPIHRNSIRRKISGTKFAKKSSKTMHSNPWTPCAPSSSRLSSTSNAIERSSAPSRPFPTSSTHSDVELV